MKPLFISITLLAVLSVCASAAQSLSPVASPQPAKFAVPDSQVKALDIKTVPLQDKVDAVQASFPAQVVVPPNAEQIVSSPVVGMVAQLLVQQNQAVRLGAPLVRIASPELGQLQLQLLQTTARATLAGQAAKREQALFDEGIIPQRRVQEAQAALSESEAALHQAKAALRLGGMPPATIDQIAASGKPQDSITLTAAKAGVVTEIEVKPGQRVEAATALLHLLQTDVLWLDIQVPVSDNSNWRAGTRLKVQGRDIEARILSAGSTVSVGSQTVGLRAAVDGKAKLLRPGEFVTVELPVARPSGSWDIPLAAVAHDGNQAYVFIRTTGGFEARVVKVSASAGQRVRVQGALKADEQVAVAGVVALKGAWLNAKENK